MAAWGIPEKSAVELLKMDGHTIWDLNQPSQCAKNLGPEPGSAHTK